MKVHPGATETAQWVKATSVQAWQSEFGFQIPCKKPGVLACICVPSVPKVRERPETKSEAPSPVYSRAAEMRDPVSKSQGGKEEPYPDI